MSHDFEVEMSKLSRKTPVCGKEYDVDIYRGEHGGWILEIVDKHGTSTTVWDDEFDTGQAALDEALEVIESGDIEKEPSNVIPFPNNP